MEVLRTPYRIDIMQPLYFIINDFDDLFTILDQDILALIEESKKLGDYEPLYPPKEKAVEEDDETVGMGAMKC